MPEFIDQDLTGARFEDVILNSARFRNVVLTNAVFELIDLSGAVIRGADLVNVEINGDLEDVRINGVDVVPLVEAELDRRHPERAKMRPESADGFREAWATLERLWGETVERARLLAPELLSTRVDGEWSFIETLRHLVFATDAWIRRAVLGEPSPWDPLDLPHDEMQDDPAVPRDREAHPTLEGVLALRTDRLAIVRQVLADLTDERLADSTEPVDVPGYPPPDHYSVGRCLRIVLNEEWSHRLYAERDLEALAAQTG